MSGVKNFNTSLCLGSIAISEATFYVFKKFQYITLFRFNEFKQKLKEQLKGNFNTSLCLGSIKLF